MVNNRRSADRYVPHIDPWVGAKVCGYDTKMYPGLGQAPNLLLRAALEVHGGDVGYDDDDDEGGDSEEEVPPVS